jgi:hypothetical protein
MLLDQPGIFWIDASVRFKNSSLNFVQQQIINESRGVLMFDNAVHSIFQATHHTMYKYLPISMTAAVRSSMMSANAIYIRCSSDVCRRCHLLILPYAKKLTVVYTDVYKE